MDLSNDDFSRFLAAHQRGGYRCNFCNHEAYLVNTGRAGSEHETIPAELLVSTHVKGESGAHNFFSIACANCGRSDFFHVNQISRWLQNNSAGGKR